jgi:hypothetical protein
VRSDVIRPKEINNMSNAGIVMVTSLCLDI